MIIPPRPRSAICLPKRWESIKGARQLTLSICASILLKHPPERRHVPENCFDHVPFATRFSLPALRPSALMCKGCLLCLRVPESRALGHFLQSLHKLRSIPGAGRDIASAQLRGMLGRAHDGHDRGKRQDRLIRSRPKPEPFSRMLFRPEEMDPASGKGPVLRPIFDRDIDVADHAVRVPLLDDSVAH